MKSEIEELAQSPMSQEETADCFLLLIQIAKMNGTDLLQQARRKFEINKQRIWTAKKDGSYHHEEDADHFKFRKVS